MHKTSLIITIFNRSQSLRKALLSLQNQSVKPSELILSDDGSEEDIVNVIKDITKQLDFPVKYVKQENKGFRLAKARNNGVRNSSGDLLIFLDQDLIYTENMIKTFIDSSKRKRFTTGMPVWLRKEESTLITEETILKNKFLSLITAKEKAEVEKQYRKDKRYYYLHKLGLTNQPRLRGGVCGINRSDFETINGYDEKFIGWGAEDDDIGKRLYRTGVEGFNPFNNEFAIHLYHERVTIANKGVKEQANYKYYQQKKEEIKSGKFRTEFGLHNPYEGDEIEVIELN